MVTIFVDDSQWSEIDGRGFSNIEWETSLLEGQLRFRHFGDNSSDSNLVRLEPYLIAIGVKRIKELLLEPLSTIKSPDNVLSSLVYICS